METERRQGLSGAVPALRSLTTPWPRRPGCCCLWGGTLPAALKVSASSGYEAE